LLPRLAFAPRVLNFTGGTRSKGEWTVQNATLERKVQMRLNVSRKEAARELQAAAKIGQAIRGQRIREMRDLDEARREKQEWVQRTMELLGMLVTTSDWTEYFNDFVAPILPEYAEFDMFVDLFEAEMKHRLERLEGFFHSVDDLPEPIPVNRPQPGQHRSPHPEMTQVLDEALGAARQAAAAASAAAASAAAAAAAPDESSPELDDVSRAPLETIYTPPTIPTPSEAKMPQQQHQLQQQQARPTVAAQILMEPNQQPTTTRAPSAASSSGGSGGAAVSSNVNVGAVTPSSTSVGPSRGSLVARANDEPAVQAIVAFLERLGVVLRVIDRRTPSGLSIVDELNAQSGARFVLMFTDSAGAATTADDLFELGCCVGRMTADRVFALHRGGDAGTDRFGIAHIPLDGTDGWQLQLARQLRKAGVSVDLNKLV
jgi:hypothetical protein